MKLLIGTETHFRSKGIYQCIFNQTTGAFSEPTCLIETENPTWITLNKNATTLFSICEEATSAIVESYDLQTDEIHLINRISFAANNPCHSCYTDNTLIVSCYVSGSVASLPVGSKGELQPPASLFHQANSPMVRGQSIDRQQSAHIHSAIASPCGNTVWCLDLGKDQILQFDFDKQSKQLSLNQFYQVTAGSGPRHMAIHPNGQWLYAAMELNLTVTCFHWDGQQLTQKETAQCTRAAPTKEVLLSEILIHPNGRFCYVAVRGNNEIACFSINQKTGSLTLLSLTNCGGNWPRHIALSPNGQWLLVANQLSGNVSLLSVDLETGELKSTQQKLLLDTPMCLRLISDD